MKIEQIISFTGTQLENAEDQMQLSAALAVAVGTLDTVSGALGDDLQFSIYWRDGFIKLEAGGATLQFTQPEALHKAAILRQAALDGGATVDCSL